jgi:hypothetical protein
MRFLAFVLWVANVSCQGPDCAAIGCAEGVDIAARTDPPAELKAGVYRVEVVAAGQTWSCELDLPAVTHCDDRPGLMATAYRKDTVSGLETLGIRVGLTPKIVRVRVFRDDALIGESEYSPSYTYTQLGDDPDHPCFQSCYYSGNHTLMLDE